MLIRGVAAMRKKVMKPYTFSDGIHVPAGNWITVATKSILRDPTLYPNAEQFNGLRFAQASAQTTGNGESNSDPKKPNRFTETSSSYPFWGIGKHAW